jgi:biofilm protein TabA
MKIKTSLFFGILIVLVISCTSKSSVKSPDKWSKAEASEWFDKKEWLGQTTLLPDSSFNKQEFALMYNNHKEWWDKAFNFLKNEDLSALTVGVHEIDSQRVYAKVTEYNSKNREEVPFEAHKDYADIQYVISGSEYIERAPMATATLKTPYDKAKDIVFYDGKENWSVVGNQGVFFIILPNDLHRSGIKVEESVPVKKIVIKVRI